MKYEMMFFGSCGHVEITEISQKAFVRYTQELGFNAIGTIPPCRFRIGRVRSRVYVYPGRYCACSECWKADMDGI